MNQPVQVITQIQTSQMVLGISQIPSTQPIQSVLQTPFNSLGHTIPWMQDNQPFQIIP